MLILHGVMTTRENKNLLPGGHKTVTESIFKNVLQKPSHCASLYYLTNNDGTSSFRLAKFSVHPCPFMASFICQCKFNPTLGKRRMIMSSTNSPTHL